MNYLAIKDRFIIPPEEIILIRALKSNYAIDLLKTEELYFSRADDKSHGINTEGVITIEDILRIKERHKNSGRIDWEESSKKEIDILRLQQKYTFISCWNSTGIETRFIWNNYGKEKLK